MKEPKFTWDEETGIARCYITIKNLSNQTIIGEAHCHPEDMDMCSEKTGCEIAYFKAVIKMLKHYIDNNLQPRLNALNKLYYSMNMSQQFNPKSYENKMLQRQIRLTKNELDTAKEWLDDRKVELKEYLKRKDDFYAMVRSMRRVEKEEEKHKADN